jgi:N-acetylglucosamine kinase-like BadF-type ATPase
MIKLVCDSGATKAEWCLINKGKKKTFITQGISPYFLNVVQIKDLLLKELKPKFKNIKVDEIYYYGTGCANPANARLVKKAIQLVFTNTKKIEVTHDLMAAARSVCGKKKGVVANLGTGSFCCYYDGKKIMKQIPGIGYVLGDEGSGAYLGKKVIQYYLYETFDDDLRQDLMQNILLTGVRYWKMYIKSHCLTATLHPIHYSLRKQGTLYDR